MCFCNFINQLSELRIVIPFVYLLCVLRLNEKIKVFLSKIPPININYVLRVKTTIKLITNKMEVIIKLNNQTAGKDKVARLLQYLCRAVWDSLNQNELNIELIEKLKSLEYILSSFRKLLRFGKCLDVFYSSFSSLHYPDVVVRTTLTLSKISSALYLFADHIIWLIRSGLFRNFDSQKWNTAANKYWLFSITMNLCRDFYEIMRLIDMRRNYRSVTRPKKVSANPSVVLLQVIEVLHEHKSVAIDTIKNLCDVFIPLSALGYTKLNPRVIGVLGAVSSLAGLIAIIQPTAKLVPA